MKKKLLSLILSSIILTTTMGITKVNAAPVNVPGSTYKIERFGGATRFETAVEVAKQFCKSNAELGIRIASNDINSYADTAQKAVDTVILANAFNFPDSICAAPLTRIYNAPILLTSVNSLNSSTKQFLQERKIKNIVITGGTGVVSEKVENELKTMGINILARYGGKDRYETSLQIAQKVQEVQPVHEAFITGPNNYEEALTASPASALYLKPILLLPIGNNGSDQYKKDLEAYVNKVYDDFKVAYPKSYSPTYYTLGSEKEVTKETAKKFNSGLRFGQTDSHIYNNIQINSGFQSTNAIYNQETNVILMVTAKDFPDSLTAAPLAAKVGGKILFAGWGKESKQWIQDNLAKTLMLSMGLSQEILDKLDPKEHMIVKDQMDGMIKKNIKTPYLNKVYYIGGDDVTPIDSWQKINGQW